MSTATKSPIPRAYGTPAEIAAYLGRSDRWVRTQVSLGRFPSSTIGGCRFIRFSDVDRVMESARDPDARTNRGVYDRDAAAERREAAQLAE